MPLRAGDFAHPDESREFDHGRVDVLRLDGHPVSRMTYAPGWIWSHHVRPVAGTTSCRILHIGYVLRGRLAVRMDDDVEAVASAGQAVLVPPGHDGWVVGDDECVILDWGGGAYAVDENAV